MLKSISIFFNRLTCTHQSLTWVRNIYGDEIFAYAGNRSIWQCVYCGKVKLRGLHTEPKSSVEAGIDVASEMAKMEQETVNNERMVALAAATKMVYEAQDIQERLLTELDILQYGHALHGPCGRRGFDSLEECASYLKSLEISVTSLRSKIGSFKRSNPKIETENMAQTLERIRALAENPE